ncbi:Homogentisate phytyltransferase 1, chloroplastic, partial [Linum perenne]
VVIQALSIFSVSLLSVQKVSDISPLFCTGLLEVNKPYLPLASGEYSVGMGVFIVASFSVMSFWLGWIVKSWPLFWALFISFVLGTAYSINLPFLRWKRFAFVAALCILAVRAVIVQICFYLHMQDIPDMEGDKIFGIKSFTVQGLKKVFWTCIALLEIAYGIAMMVGAASPFVWSKCITVIGHTILSFLLWNRAKSVDLSSKD